MEHNKVLHILLISFLLIFLTPSTYGWGYEGHIAVCKIAQARLSKTAIAAVKKLLPTSTNGDLGPLCPWADTIKFRYPWSSSLHYINTPDRACSFTYARDCQDRNGAKARCLVGAINNYTNALQDYPNNKNHYNLTETLLFLSHFLGDIHQPLHVGFTSDRGGNTIKVKWFNRKSNLHHVWDTDIITKAKAANASNINGFITNIQQKINSQWGKQVKGWVTCKKTTCTNSYAAESIKAACGWAYKGVQSGSILRDDYFNTRLPIVELRIAQAGVRLQQLSINCLNDFRLIAQI